MFKTSATLYDKRLTFRAEKTSEGYKVYSDQFPDFVGEGRIIQEAVREILNELKFYIHIYGEIISKGIPMSDSEEFRKVYTYFTN